MPILRALCATLVGATLTLIAAAAAAADVNTATQAELERIKGIGVQLSSALVAERAKRPFADWQDLRARVRGIGPKQAASLSQSGLTVAGAPWPATPQPDRAK